MVCPLFAHKAFDGPFSVVFVLAGTVTDGALPGSHHFHCFTGPTVALFSSTTLTVSSCFVHFDDTLGGTENIGCNTVSNPNGQTEKLCPWVDYCSLFRCTNESDCLCQFTWPDRAATPPFSITPISGATDFYDQESVSQEKTLTTNNSVIHTMPPNTQDCRPTFVFVVSVVELMVTKSQAY